MLNFKDWKLASQDGTRATLKHANGHEMTIAMKSLPKIQREQIMRLAKVQQYKDGGSVQKFEEGTPESVQADRGPDSDSAPQPTATAPVKIEINSGTSAPSPVVAPSHNPAAIYAGQPVNVQPPTILPGVRNLGVNGTMNPEAIAKNTQEVAQDTGKLQAAQAEAATPVEETYLKGRQQTEATAQDLFNQMKGHTDQFGTYVQQHEINPNAYVENMGAGKKTLSGLGLILGGLGAGQLGSTDNPALRFLNSQIDRDIAGQQARVNNQRTILGAYQDLYGAGVAANNLTKASLLDIYNHKLQLIANKLGTPAANLAAKKFGADAALEKSKLLQEAAVNLSQLPGSHGTSSDMGAMNTPKPGAPTNQPGGLTTDELQAMHDKQASGDPMAAGISPKSAAEGEIKFEPITPILHNGAEQMRQGLKYTPKARDPEEMHEITRQFTQAQQADKQLAQINGIFGSLATGAEKGGVFGRAYRTGGHALGALGSIIGGERGAAAGEGSVALLGNETNRLYEANKTSLFGALSSALKGTNVGDGSIHDVVNKNAPEYGDSPATLKRKHDNIEHFIKSHVETSLLKTYHLTDE